MSDNESSTVALEVDPAAARPAAAAALPGSTIGQLPMCKAVLAGNRNPAYSHRLHTAFPARFHASSSTQLLPGVLWPAPSLQIRRRRRGLALCDATKRLVFIFRWRGSSRGSRPSPARRARSSPRSRSSCACLETRDPSITS